MWNLFFENLKKNRKVIFLLQCVIYTRSYASIIKQMVPFKSLREFHHEDVKYILLWQAKESFKDMFGNGQQPFIRNYCPVNSCFVSTDQYMFGGDLSKFDAILFNGWDQTWYLKGGFPKKRYYHQKYVYVQKESAARAYVCLPRFDNFYNWTMTYKLNSDIVLPHIYVRDVNKGIVGPKKNMHWNTETAASITFGPDLESKTKAVAWFYTNCKPSSTIRDFVEKLERALNKYGFNIDVYGKCGPLHCSECNQMLDNDYYFYLAIEESFAEDYVTGNVLRALRSNVVPIVYGGANYSRFLPPESYLDGKLETPKALAAKINTLITNQNQYRRYFQWKSRYSFSLGMASPKLPLDGITYSGQTMCDLCQALHDPNKFNVRSSYKSFRKWWYPDYAKKCDKRAAIEKLQSDKLKNKRKKKNKTRKDKKGKQIPRKNIDDNDVKKNTDDNVDDKTDIEELNVEDEENANLRKTATMSKVTQVGGNSQGSSMVGSQAWHNFGLPTTGGSGGGGGGGISRTAGMVAIEMNRVRLGLLTNNFDLYRR